VASHITEMDAPRVKERLIREMSEIYRGSLFFGEDDADADGRPGSTQARLIGPGTSELTAETRR